jgi:hypothetical protein
MTLDFAIRAFQKQIVVVEAMADLRQSHENRNSIRRRFDRDTSHGHDLLRLGQFQTPDKFLIFL